MLGQLRCPKNRDDGHVVGASSVVGYVSPGGIGLSSETIIIVPTARGATSTHAV